MSFSCESVGFPKPDITWYKDNERMNSRHFNKEKGEITFSSVQFSDRGSYRCEARNFLGVDSVTIEVAVEGMQTSKAVDFVNAKTQMGLICFFIEFSIGLFGYMEGITLFLFFF